MAYLDCSRQQVYHTLRQWIVEGVAGCLCYPHPPASAVQVLHGRRPQGRGVAGAPGANLLGN